MKNRSTDRLSHLSSNNLAHVLRPFMFELRPLDDELVDSFIARHIAMLMPNNSREIWTYLGRPVPGRQVLLPSGLSMLANNLPSRTLTVEHLIENHTVYPYVEPFLNSDKRLRLNAALRADRGDIGFLIPGGNTDRLRFCPQCRAEQLNSLGLSSWSRVPQLKEVFVCLQHEVPLRQISFAAFGSTGLAFMKGLTGETTEIQLPFSVKRAIKMARLTAEFLNNHKKNEFAIDLGEYTRKLFIDAKLVSETGRIRRGMINTFIEVVGDDVLKSSDLSIDLKRPYNSWLYKIVRKKDQISAIKLVIILDFMSIDSMLGTRPRPFELSNSGRTLYPNKYLPPTRQVLHIMRSRIVGMVNLGMPRAQISKQDFKTYRTLAKHDKIWLEKNLPAKLKTRGVSKYDLSNDSCLSKRLKVAGLALITVSTMTPSRITKYSLLAQADLLGMASYLTDLPMCSIVVEHFVDTRLSFWRRRLMWGSARVKVNGHQVSWSEFLELIDLRPVRDPDIIEEARAEYMKLCANIILPPI